MGGSSMLSKCIAALLVATVAVEAIKAKGVDEIIVYCINDGAVMNAWADSQGVGRDGEGSMVNFLADTGGELTDALGMRMNHPGPQFKFKQGRSKRFSAFIDDGIVKILNLAENNSPDGSDDPAGDDYPKNSLPAKMFADMDALGVKEL